MGIAVLEAFNVGGHLDDAQSERRGPPHTRDENKARDIMRRTRGEKTWTHGAQTFKMKAEDPERD
ncbi:MAG: hypothetical protein ACLQO1_15365 [Steroidobacteraceae bacterium]